MSYILDALRRADAERERGSVPSIHTQQQFTSTGGDDEGEARPRRLHWIVAALSIALIAVVGWILFRPAPDAGVAVSMAPKPVDASPSPAPAGLAPTGPATIPPTAATPSTTAAAPSTTAPLPPSTAPAVALPKPPPAAPGANRAATAAVTATPSAATPPATGSTARPSRHATAGAPAAPVTTATAPREVATPAPAPRDATPAAPRDAGITAAPPREATTAVGTAEARATAERRAASGPAEDRVYAQRELPDDIRKALPAVTVNGSTYSADSASRMLMIGGQIYHEGDAIAPGLVLQRIKQRSAIMAFRGYRYEMTF
jgi:general secretion pathway protein B